MGKNYEKYLEFCRTERQIEVIKLVIRHGSLRKAVDATGTPYSTLQEIFGKVAKRAALSGKDPANNLDSAVPNGHLLTGTSRLTKEPDGSLLWTKTNVSREQQLELLQETIKDMVADVPRIPVHAKPQHETDDDILTVYPLGDPHIGMMSWGEETGCNWDLKIAENVFGKVFDKLVDAAPRSRTCRIIDLGDFLHSDNMDGTTSRSGNVLDMDGRYCKVLRVGVRVIRRMIERALDKHELVTVDILKGNHNDIGALWMAELLSNCYENEPRVVIEKSPSPYHYFQFGKVLLGTTHGHNCKKEKLAGIMACDVPEMWGATKFREWITGHVHHDEVKDLMGCVFRSFRTLAGHEAYSQAAGYRADQDSKFHVYHKDYGLRMQYTVNILEVM